MILREGSFFSFFRVFLVFSSRKDTNLESTPGMETKKSNYYLTEPVSSPFTPLLAVSGRFNPQTLQHSYSTL